MIVLGEWKLGTGQAGDYYFLRCLWWHLTVAIRHMYYFEKELKFKFKNNFSEVKQPLNGGAAI